jgi:hypothetical protein
MNEPKIPTVLAVGFWVASGLAVFTYTFIAFKETATGAEALGLTIAEHSATTINPLVAGAAILGAEEVQEAKKPLNRRKFRKSK